MSSIKPRKPLALTALLATSISGLALGAGAAHATTLGDPGLPNPISLTDDSGVVHNLDASGHEISSVALPHDASHVAWSGQGGRLAYVSNGAIWTADSDGSHPIEIVAVPAGGSVFDLQWDAPSDAVYFAMSPDGSPQGLLFSAPADGSYFQHDIDPVVLIDAGQLATAGMGGIESFDVSAAGTLVAEGTNSDVRIIGFDGQGNPTFSPAFTGFLEPTISPDGKTVVVSQNTGAGVHLFSTSLSGNTWTTPVQVTWSAGSQSAPRFLVDGTHVVYTTSTADDVLSGTATADITKSVQPDGGTPGSNPSEKTISAAHPDVHSGYAVRTDVKSQVTRFAGATRYDTAVQASQAEWRKNGDTTDTHRQQAQSVVIARGDVFADALGGAALAAAKHGPLLLTDPHTLTWATLTEMQRILPITGTVYILGGTNAVSPAVESMLAISGFHIQRIAGDDRYGTATAIAGQITAKPKRVLVATGLNFPDALSAAAVAAEYPDTVVVLSADDAMPAATQNYLLDVNYGGGPGHDGMEIFGIGHQATNALVSSGWGLGSFSLAGDTRYLTSFMVAQAFFGGANTVSLATGLNAPDALSAGAFMGQLYGPLLLVDPQAGLSPEENAWIDSERGSTSFGFIFGGSGALPGAVDGQLGADISTATGVSVGTFDGVTPLTARPQTAQTAQKAQTQAETLHAPVAAKVTKATAGAKAAQG